MWRLFFRAGVRPLAVYLSFFLLSAAERAADSVAIPLAITLRPAAADSHQLVPYVDITLTYATPGIVEGQPFLKIPLVISNVETVAKTIDGLSVRDDTGSVSVVVKDDPENAASPCRHWLSSRAAKGTLTVHYRATISNIA